MQLAGYVDPSSDPAPALHRDAGVRSRAWLAGILAAGLGLAPAPVRGGWEPQPPLPMPRRLLAAAVVDGKIYTFGGCGSPCFDPVLHPSTLEETSVEVFDPGAPPDAAWSPRAPIPSIFFSGASAVLDDSVYLAGGVASPNVLLRYDPATDAWTNLKPMPTARSGLALAALDGRLYAVGGNGPSAALEVYDPATDSWSAGAPMPTARVFLAAVATAGRIYAIGGSPDGSGDSRTDVLEIYDPAADAWTAGAPLPVAQQLSAAVAVGGKIYTFGGFIPGTGAQDNVFVYGPATDVWSRGDPLPTPRDQAAAVVLDGHAHVLGGSVDCHCLALDTHERYVAAGGGGAVADLAITKTNGLDDVVACTGTATLTYALTITNRGPSPVVGAVVRDSFPASLWGVAWSCQECSPAAGSGDLECLVDLDPGKSTTCTATGTVDAGAMGNLVNTATVSPPANVTDSNLTNNTATDRDPIRKPADLEITKTNGVDSVSACGDIPSYVIKVTNRGPCPVDGATVEDVFSPFLPTVIWTCEASPGASCTPASPAPGTPIDDTIVLPVGATVTYTATGALTDDAGGTLVNSAWVHPPAGVTDPDTTNNHATDADPILRAADLEVTKTNHTLKVRACDEIPPYVITVTNRGPCPVDGATVEDVFPPFLPTVTWTCKASPGASCTPASPAPGAPIDDTVVLPVGATVTYTATGTLTDDASGMLVNSVWAHPPEGVVDSDETNNHATDKDLIVRIADLEITKTNDAEEVFACESTEYRITVTNHGPCPVAGAEVSDVFPPQLEGIPPLGETVDLADGESVVFPEEGIVAKDAFGLLSNTATVLPPGDPKDPDGNNDRATDEDPILRREADLELTKKVVAPAGFDTLTYTVSISNDGPEAALAARVEDDFPAALDVVSWTCTVSGSASCGEVAGMGDLDQEIELDPGASVTYTVGATLRPTAVGEICNTATVTTTGCFLDGAGDNDADTACLTVPDCNSNGIRDAVDIATGTSQDLNGDMVPDECPLAPPPPIPTLSTWALALLGLLTGLAGSLSLAARRQPSAAGLRALRSLPGAPPRGNASRRSCRSPGRRR